MRLDLYLFSKGFYISRQKAKYDIENGYISVNNKVILKPGFDITESDIVSIKEKEEKYVSRAGYKLSKAINSFKISIKDKVILDIGASTGGFTDYCLQHGAKKVYSVDVGHGQLAQSLLNDKRVINKENLNFRYATSNDLDNTLFDVVCIDVSFIPLEIILENIFNFINENSEIICLIKPQFELFEEAYKGKGLISKKEDHIKAINKVIDFCKSKSLRVLGLDFSPIVGEKKDNIEYLIYIKYSKLPNLTSFSIKDIVNQAHKNLK